jgi:putative tricarboxylic transport membrane protein
MRAFLIICAVLFTFGPADAAQYPSRPIIMVVPFAAGGATDVIARIIAEPMSRKLGQPIIIENVAGAGGTIGTAKVKAATGDGYTLITGHMGTHASAFSLYQKPTYDPRTDFEPVGLIASAPIVIFSRRDFPAKTLKEFSDELIAKGDNIKVAHSGIGSNAHLTYALFQNLIGAKSLEIGYRGNGPLMNDLVAGFVDYSCDQVITFAPQIESGSVKGVAIASPNRSPVLPNLPTTTEGSLPAFQADAWTALFAPKNTPADVLDIIYAAYLDALNDQNTQRRLLALGAGVPGSDQRSEVYFRQLVSDEVLRWSNVIKASGLALQ